MPAFTQRGALMMKIADDIESQTEELARNLALEAGKAIRTEGRGEVKASVDLFRYFGGVAGELKGETVPYGESILTYTRREPLGVVGAIVPWNGPFILASVKVASLPKSENSRPL